MVDQSSIVTAVAAVKSPQPFCHLLPFELKKKWEEIRIFYTLAVNCSPIITTLYRTCAFVVTWPDSFSLVWRRRVAVVSLSSSFGGEEGPNSFPRIVMNNFSFFFPHFWGAKRGRKEEGPTRNSFSIATVINSATAAVEWGAFNQVWRTPGWYKIRLVFFL